MHALNTFIGLDEPIDLPTISLIPNKEYREVLKLIRQQNPVATN